MPNKEISPGNVQSMFNSAQEIISPKELKQALGLGAEQTKVSGAYLTGLGEILSYINETPLENVHKDMKATRSLIEFANERGMKFSSPLDAGVHSDRKKLVMFNQMLRRSNELLCSYFKFHLEEYSDDLIKSDKLKVGAAVVDGYSVFAAVEFGITSQDLPKQKVFMGQVANAICEVAAELRDNSVELNAVFEMASQTGWYSPDFEFDEGFLQRQGFLHSD